MNSETLGERVAKLRKEEGLTQKELAGRADISTPFVSDIENDKRNVSSSVLYQIAEALETSLDYLMTGEENRPVKPRSRKIPPQLNVTAEENDWPFADTVALLEAAQMVLARRGGKGKDERRSVEDLSRKDWEALYERLIDD